MQQRLLYLSGRAVIWLYARVMLRLDIRWQGSAPVGPTLIVANHPSCTDPFFLGLLFPRPVSLLIVEKPFSIPVFGAYLRRSGHVPVVPGNGRPAFDAAHELLQTGRSVALFPEGEVSPQQGGFHRPRSGAARLALLTGVPILPVGIYLPRERNRLITSSIAGKHSVGYWYLRGTYHVTVGEAMYFGGDVEDRSHVTSVSESIMRQIISLADESERRATGKTFSWSPGW